MPVWHELTREARASGELVVLGITQEQHPERCELFAQWQGLDWPILWDPFNLTGSKVVPNAVAIDEHGVVRLVGARPAQFMQQFMQRDFPAPDEQRPARQAVCAYGERHGRPLGPIEWGMRGQPGRALEALEAQLAQHPDDARSAFRAGVARRLRYDSSEHQPEDFQLAVEHWAHALALDPNQYIWRRRIQQYGPRMDKPYPFYDWVAQARRELLARGEQPVALVAGLTQAELAQPRRRAASASEARPVESDPEGRIKRDDQGLVELESALAFGTGGDARVASLHLTLRPNALLDAHWNQEAGAPLEVWLEEPEGWTWSARRLLGRLASESATSSELLRLNTELSLPEGLDQGIVRGYALYNVCEGEAGTCLYRRQDFSIELELPE